MSAVRSPSHIFSATGNYAVAGRGVLRPQMGVVRGPGGVVRGPEHIVRMSSNCIVEELLAKALNGLPPGISAHAAECPVADRRSSVCESIGGMVGTVTPSASQKPVAAAVDRAERQEVGALVEKQYPDVTTSGIVPKQIADVSKGKDWSWLRFDNTPKAREARRQVASVTLEVTSAGGCRFEGRTVALSCVGSMKAGTCCVARSSGNVEPPPPLAARPFPATTIKRSKQGALALELAKDSVQKEGQRVAVVSAASAYHCGGGFLTGGRHALEEAMCSQTTLYASIAGEMQKAMAMPKGPQSQASTHAAYIPHDGAVLSPHVEIFRSGTDRGYSLLQEPVELAAVISVAMFNKNPKVSDAPLDSPDEPEYEQAIQNKFRSVLAGAIKAQSDVLVMPDVGCGVYQNDPKVVGRVFGQVLGQEFSGSIKEVVVCGSAEFQDAVQAAAKAEEEASKKDRVIWEAWHQDKEQWNPMNKLAEPEVEEGYIQWLRGGEAHVTKRILFNTSKSGAPVYGLIDYANMTRTMEGGKLGAVKIRRRQR